MGPFSRVKLALARRFTYARDFLFAERDSRRNLSNNTGRNVFVLCYGNIYRSPFVAQRLTDVFPDSEWEIRSAGFHEKGGRTCDETFVELAAQFGVSIDEHRSRRVVKEDLDWADLIIIMDGRNRLLLHEMSADTAHKVVWIGVFLPGFRPDVIDPFGMSQERVESTVNRLYQATEALARELRRLNS